MKDKEDGVVSDNKKAMPKEKPEVVPAKKADTSSEKGLSSDAAKVSSEQTSESSEEQKPEIEKAESAKEADTDQETSVRHMNKASSKEDEKEQKKKDATVKLKGLFGFKLGMSMMYNDAGEAVPITVVKSENWFVSQIKTSQGEGYSAVQVAHGPLRAKMSQRSRTKHCQRAGFENGARTLREIRQNLPDGIEVGQRVSLETLNKGDRVKITSSSKGRGFSGVMRRYDFGGGPAAHGSQFHRGPGSVGNRTWPGRVIPGRKMPGRYGGKNITVRGVEVLNIIPDENLIFIKGGVPGARNTLVRILRED